MKTVWILMLAGGLALMSLDVMATKMYRWTDANGNPVVSDRPPPAGTPYTEISDSYSPETRKQALRDTPGARRPSEPTPVAGSDDLPTAGQKVRELCQRALDHIDKLENAPTIATTDGAGNVRVLSDEERAQQLADARAMAAKHCDN